MNKEPQMTERVLQLLEKHFQSFYSVADLATETGHPVPVDTRGWSQILVSILTGIKGLIRKKGADLDDGSDVKGANTWEAIDTPRFNGVLKAGTKAKHSDRMESLNDVPFLFFVLWDIRSTGAHRCRLWCVRPQTDKLFRKMARAWYAARKSGKIKSSNCQLHPPRGEDTDLIYNKFGRMVFPLLFAAERDADGLWHTTHYKQKVMATGLCSQG